MNSSEKLNMRSNEYAEHISAEHIGEAIRSARRSAGLTLRSLAAQLHVSAATLSAIENGKTGVSVTRLEALAAATGTTAGALMTKSRSAPLPSDHEADDSHGESAWRQFDELRLDAVLQAALDSFVEIGYHATTMRVLAQRARLSVPGIYHHYPDKQALLVRVLDLTMADLHRRVAGARAEARTSLAEVANIVEALALFHTHYSALAFIGASEMRSLAGDNRVRIAAERSRLQHILDEAIARATSDGLIDPVDAPTAGRAISTMCTSIPQWFHRDGAQSAEEVAQAYVQIALLILRPSLPRKEKLR